MKFILTTMCCISITSFADYGDLLKTFQFRVDMFALHPSQEQVYVSSSTEGLIRVIDLNSLSVVDTIPTFSKSIGMAFSDNGENLFVSSSDRKSIDVYNTQSKALTNSISTPIAAYDLEMGKNGTLYATPTHGLLPETVGIMRINTSSMEYETSFWGGIPMYAGGYLEIDNATNKLYHGDAGVPTLLTKFDVSTDQPVMEWQNIPYSLGQNGKDLALSNDGKLITYMVGTGNQGYVINLMDTTNFGVQGVFTTGAYPIEGCFSPDDKIFYATHYNQHIDVWNVETFQQLPDILLQGFDYNRSQELFVDPSGKYLFAEIDGTHLKVFDTGREIPEPATLSLLALGMIFMKRRRYR